MSRKRKPPIIKRIGCNPVRKDLPFDKSSPIVKETYLFKTANGETAWKQTNEKGEKRTLYKDKDGNPLRNSKGEIVQHNDYENHYNGKKMSQTEIANKISDCFSLNIDELNKFWKYVVNYKNENPTPEDIENIEKLAKQANEYCDLFGQIAFYIIDAESKKGAGEVAEIKKQARKIIKDLEAVKKEITQSMVDETFKFAVCLAISNRKEKKFTMLFGEHKGNGQGDRLNEAIAFFEEVDRSIQPDPCASKIYYWRNEINEIIGKVYLSATGEKPRLTGGKKNRFQKLHNSLNGLFSNNKWLKEGTSLPLGTRNNTASFFEEKFK